MPRLPVWIVCLAVLAGCDADRMSTDDPVWRLYAESEGQPPRSVGTFDLMDKKGGAGNREGCETVREAMQAAQPDVRYVCVVGRHPEADGAGS